MFDNLSLLGLVPMLNLQLLLDGLLIGSVFALAAYGLAPVSYTHLRAHET